MLVPFIYLNMRIHPFLGLLGFKGVLRFIVLMASKIPFVLPIFIMPVIYKCVP